MLKKNINKAFSILERLNLEEEERKSQQKEIEHKKTLKKKEIKHNKEKSNQQLNNNYKLKTNNQINNEKLQELINKPEFYIQLMSFLLFIKQKYPYELKALKYFLTSYEPIEERVMLAYLYFWFGIHMYLISQSIPSIKYK